MENRYDIVSCECSDLSCDWQVKAIRDVRAMFLHRWKEQPSISTTEVRNEIESMYGIKCPKWKVFCAENRAKQILGLDYDKGYAILHQFKEEMERIDRDNIMLLETESHESREEERFKRVFVCCERTSYAFKVHCRGILAVDGWKINNLCNSVMLVAPGLDGNNRILPVAFCEVQVENLDSWVYFLKNINSALRLENGKGLCILGDGDNGVEYAVEEYLPRVVEKVTPIVQDIIHDRCIDGWRFIVRKQTGTILGIKYMRRKIEDYMDNTMYVENYMSTYAPGMMQLPQEYAWKWDAGHTLLPPINLPLKPISAKGTNDLTSNKHLLHVADQYPTPTRNLQWTQDNNSNNSSEHTSLLIIISTTSSDTISKDP
ncbi:hypothetical protein WN944_001641 [Citrus x changshan-huyou]|uniref:MULE transposase domain-containing protein n=1 Tax=Citrus x changshan-huyou TaxID=2935761 RepID=A0AAP0QQZ1_9ROSI